MNTNKIKGVIKSKGQVFPPIYNRINKLIPVTNTSGG
jgi:hypothetical protein